MNLLTSLLFTLLYGDIFQYPYTKEELISWLPKKTRSIQGVQKKLQYLLRLKKISYKAPYYYIYGHGSYVDVRRKRESYERRKWKKARFAAWHLRLIPTITLVGVTGGLAIHNADKQDDIDFYIGVKSGTLWVSRFVATLVMELLGIRRRPGDIEVTDAICLNMFVSEKAFMIPKQEQDVFTAHEALQMTPLWDRGGAYTNFLKRNAWASALFPNKWKEVWKKVQPTSDRQNQNNFIIWFFRFLEIPLKHLQLLYMQKRRTNEIISDTVIRFHPRDARVWVRQLIEKRSQRANLLLDKDFFQP